MKKLIFMFMLGCMLLIPGCSNGNNKDNQQQTSINGKTYNIPFSEIKTTIDTSKVFTSQDFEADYDKNKSTLIKLKGDTITSTSNTVIISGSTVTITDQGTYILSGSLDDGMIIVDAEKTDKIQLVLNNVSIHSQTSAPIYVKQAAKVSITLASNSTNTLSNGGTFVNIDENHIDAVIFSKEDLTLNGSGTLEIISPGGHGIVSKDKLILTSGIYKISSGSHGLSGKDNICIANASIVINCDKDGIHAENKDDSSLGFIYIQSGTFYIFSKGDGIAASSDMQIDDGKFIIISGDGSKNSANIDTSAKGIKTDGNLIINGGDFSIDAADDSIHSNASININGGTFNMTTGNDGIHADNTIVISSGTINIIESYEGIEGHHVKILDGEIVLYAVDDGINAAGENNQDDFNGNEVNSGNGNITISGGKLYINASGDGIDANGTLTISGGYIIVCGPIADDTAILDFDISGTIKGGTFIGTGSSRMPQIFSDSKQGIIAMKIDRQSAETPITLTDINENTIITTYKPALDFDFLIVSSPDIVKGETYNLIIGSATHEVTAN